MLVCLNCIYNDNYTYPSLWASYGYCEDCGNRGVCVSAIPENAKLKLPAQSEINTYKWLEAMQWKYFCAPYPNKYYRIFTQADLKKVVLELTPAIDVQLTDCDGVVWVNLILAEIHYNCIVACKSMELTIKDQVLPLLPITIANINVSFCIASYAQSENFINKKGFAPYIKP